MHRLNPWKAIRFRLVAGLLAAATGLFIVAAVALAFNLTRLRSSFIVEHTNEVLRNISSGERALLEAESGERGYLLTGESAYRESYNRSRDLLPKILEDLKQLISDPVQILHLDELHASIDARLTELEQVVELGPSGLDEALAILKTARSKQLTPRIETQLGQLRQTELSLLDARQQNHRRVTLLATAITGPLGMLALLSAAFGAYFLQRQRTMDLVKLPTYNFQTANRD